MNAEDFPKYAAHVEILCARYDAALAATGYDAVLLGAGRETLHFQDDQGPPFRANPLLAQWFPADRYPGALLLYRPGQSPVAVICRADSFWERPPEPPGTPWADSIEFREVGNPGNAAEMLPATAGRIALLGPENQWSHPAPAGDTNPQALLDALHYDRAVKTDWEIERMRAATRRAVVGHQAVASAFADGANEFGMLLAFLGTTRQTAEEQPYPAIIAGDHHGATLHYQHYDRSEPPAHSLLIDAGCNDHGYASDITRTHVKPAESEFAALIDAMENLQQLICKRVAPGMPFARLHHATHVLLGNLLAREGFIDASPEAIVASGATQLFFPHGLGHLIGLQVHDVGGHLANAQGEHVKAPEAYPRLRLLRTLEPGFVLTIEPGLYFIDSLLAELSAHELRDQVNWAKIERLRSCGGIRIEDNLLVTEDGSANLTREAFRAGA